MIDLTKLIQNEGKRQWIPKGCDEQKYKSNRIFVRLFGAEHGWLLAKDGRLLKLEQIADILQKNNLVEPDKALCEARELVNPQNNNYFRTSLGRYFEFKEYVLEGSLTTESRYKLESHIMDIMD